MAKKSRLDEMETVDGPFQVPDSMFDDPEPAPPVPPPPPPALPDDGHQWVTEGPPDVAAAPEPEPPAPSGAAHTWISETPPPAAREQAPPREEPEPEPEPEPAPSSSDRPSYLVDEEPRNSSAAERSGFVTEFSGEDEKALLPQPAEDLGTSALTWMALAFGGVMVGILGALLVVLVLTTAAPVQPETAGTPGEGKDPEGIQVRRGLNGPPGDPSVTNPEEPEEEEPTDVPDGGPPP